MNPTAQNEMRASTNAADPDASSQEGLEEHYEDGSQEQDEESIAEAAAGPSLSETNPDEGAIDAEAEVELATKSTSAADGGGGAAKGKGRGGKGSTAGVKSTTKGKGASTSKATRGKGKGGRGAAAAPGSTRGGAAKKGRGSSTSTATKPGRGTAPKTVVAGEVAGAESSTSSAVGAGKDAPLTEAAGSGPGPSSTVFPLARISRIVKVDKEIEMTSKDAIWTISLATELFIKHITDSAYAKARLEKKKTITYKELAAAVESQSELFFLQGESRTSPLFLPGLSFRSDTN
jgi:histone H3/H4